MQPLSGLAELTDALPRVATQNGGASQPWAGMMQSLWDSEGESGKELQDHKTNGPRDDGQEDREKAETLCAKQRSSALRVEVPQAWHERT